jgi:lipopolysaccharide/colanic/teichoic acid biosynthesis glycosyltransferase
MTFLRHPIAGRTPGSAGATEGEGLRVVTPAAPHGARRAAPVRASQPRLKLKYALDRLVALVALVLLSPLLLATAAAVLLSTGRPVVFRQTRVGRNGRHFDMLKFRSMRGDEPVQEVILADDLAPGDDGDARRTTRVGSVIRGSSLDELPQLINVLRGEMSLVGPRPERPEFVAFFSNRVSGYDDRHRVKPGITGWAQVHGLRGRTSLRKRVECDNWYIENRSLWLDVKICVMTLRCLGRPRDARWTRAPVGSALRTAAQRTRR